MSDRIKTIKRRARQIFFSNFLFIFCIISIIFIFFAGFNAVLDLISVYADVFLRGSAVAALKHVISLIALWFISQLIFLLLKKMPLGGFDFQGMTYSLRSVTAKTLLIAALLYIPKTVGSLFFVLYPYVSQKYTDFMLSVIIAVLGILIIFTVITLYYFLAGLVCVPYILADNTAIAFADAIAQSIKLMRGHKTEFILFKLTLLPWFIISYFSFCFPLFFVLPYDFICERVFFSYVASCNNIPVFYSFSDEKD